MIDKKELKKFLIENETHTIENTEEKLPSPSSTTHATPNARCSTKR